MSSYFFFGKVDFMPIIKKAQCSRQFSLASIHTNPLQTGMLVANNLSEWNSWIAFIFFSIQQCTTKTLFLKLSVSIVSGTPFVWKVSSFFRTKKKTNKISLRHRTYPQRNCRSVELFNLKTALEFRFISFIFHSKCKNFVDPSLKLFQLIYQCMKDDAEENNEVEGGRGVVGLWWIHYRKIATQCKAI